MPNAALRQDQRRRVARVVDDDCALPSELPAASTQTGDAKPCASIRSLQASADAIV